MKGTTVRLLLVVGAALLSTGACGPDAPNPKDDSSPAQTAPQLTDGPEPGSAPVAQEYAFVEKLVDELRRDKSARERNEVREVIVRSVNTPGALQALASWADDDDKYIKFAVRSILKYKSWRREPDEKITAMLSALRGDDAQNRGLALHFLASEYTPRYVRLCRAAFDKHDPQLEMVVPAVAFLDRTGSGSFVSVTPVAFGLANPSDLPMWIEDVDRSMTLATTTHSLASQPTDEPAVSSTRREAAVSSADPYDGRYRVLDPGRRIERVRFIEAQYPGRYDLTLTYSKSRLNPIPMIDCRVRIDPFTVQFRRCQLVVLPPFADGKSGPDLGGFRMRLSVDADDSGMSLSLEVRNLLDRDRSFSGVPWLAMCDDRDRLIRLESVSGERTSSIAGHGSLKMWFGLPNWSADAEGDVRLMAGVSLTGDGDGQPPELWSNVVMIP